MKKAIELNPKSPGADNKKPEKEEVPKPKLGMNKPVIGPSAIKKPNPKMNTPMGPKRMAFISALKNMAAKPGSGATMKSMIVKTLMEAVMKKAHGDKRDHPKIELFHEGKYMATTTWAPTLKHAKEAFIKKNPELDPQKVTASFKDAKKSLFTEEDLIGKPEEIKKSTVDADAAKLYKKSCDEPVAKADLVAGSKVDEMFKGWFIRQPEEMDTTKRGSKIVGYAKSGKPRLLSSFVNKAPAMSEQAHKMSQSAYGMGGQYRGADAHHDAMKAHLSAAFHQHLAGNSSDAHDHMNRAKEHQDHIGEDKVHGKNKWAERFSDTASYVGWPKKKD